MAKFVIIGGAPKTGTSSVFKYLSDHRDINPSKVKETGFFLSDDATLSIESYKEQFTLPDADKIFLEASTAYLGSSKNVPEKIRETLGNNVNIIFILRDPIERLYSYFWYRKSISKDFKYDKFYDFISDSLDFENGKYIPVNGSHIHDLSVMSRGKYSNFISRYIDLFGDKNIFLLSYEDLLKSPSSFVENICHLIGLDDSYYKNYDFRRFNETMSFHSRYLHYFADAINSKFEVFLRRNDNIKSMLKTVYKKLNLKKVGYPEVSEADRELLTAYYDASILDLAEYVDKGSFPWAFDR
jgi:hypothetical protein